MGAGLGNSTALITDGRFSGASRGFIIGMSRMSLKSCLGYLRPLSPGHVVPEALLGGPIALVKDGDRIIIDAASRTINWLVDEDEKAARRKEWDVSGKSALKERRGILYRYARDVAVSDVDASCLCVADLVAKAGQRRRILRLIPRRCLCVACMYELFVCNSKSMRNCELVELLSCSSRFECIQRRDVALHHHNRFVCSQQVLSFLPIYVVSQWHSSRI